MTSASKKLGNILKPTVELKQSFKLYLKLVLM